MKKLSLLLVVLLLGAVLIGCSQPAGDTPDDTPDDTPAAEPAWSITIEVWQTSPLPLLT